MTSLQINTLYVYVCIYREPQVDMAGRSQRVRATNVFAAVVRAGSLQLADN